MSKRILSLFLCLTMLLSLCVTVMADGEEFTFSLLANGEAEAYVEVGEVVEVTLEITENDGLSTMDLYSMQDYICYEERFLEFVSATGYTDDDAGSFFTVTEVDIDESVGEVYVGRSALTGIEVELPLVAVTIKFKALENGTTKVTHDIIELLNNGGEYPVVDEEATIIIGTGVASTKRTLTFDTKGGSTISSVTFDEGEVVNLAAYTPTRANYTFKGWYTDIYCTVPAGDSIVMDTHKTVYAGWTIYVPPADANVPYTIAAKARVNPDNGEKVFNAGETIYVDYTISSNEIDSLGSFQFDIDYDDTKLEPIAIVGALTPYDGVLYANLARGSVAFDVDGDKEALDITGGKLVATVVFTAKAGVEGDAIIGIDDTKVCEVTPLSYDKNVADIILINDSITVKKILLTFDTNGGTAIEPIYTIKYGTINLSNYIPTKSGYVFDGWYTDRTLDNKVTAVTIYDNTTVYAKWLPGSTVTFETNGGTVIESVLKATGTIVDLSDYTPTKANHTFCGWYLDPNFTTPVTSVTLNEDITAYAKWEARYTLTFETNGGSAVAKATHPAGTVVNLSGYTTTKSGYTFDGWFSDAALNNSVTKVTVNSNLTVYAKWTAATTPPGGRPGGGGGGGGGYVPATPQVKGTVTSYLSQTEPITIELFKNGESTASYTTTVIGNNVDYSFTTVASGTYTLKATKADHMTWEGVITYTESSVDITVNLCPKGDVNGNGTVTTVDFTQANSHARMMSTLTGYRLKCADVVGNDGKVTTVDAMRINAHARNVNHLW